MAEELEPWIVATQDGLGKLISKPKMTEKYLKKPPFRFLHDIIMEVCKGTGFGNGLYTVEEGDAASLADKSAKVEFLNKAISCVCFALGEKIDVSANKIVAGLEADKTNLWLQKLHIAATTAADKSEDSVQRVLAGESVAAPRKKSSKTKDGEEGEAAAPPAPAEGGDPAADEEAKKAEEKRRRAERKKREAEKAAAEEAAKAAAEGGGEAPPAPPADDGGGDAAAEEERRQKEEARRKKEEDRARREEKKRKQAEEEAVRQQEEAAAASAAAAAQQQQMAYEQQQQQAALAQQQQQQMMQQQAAQEEEQRRLMAQQPIQDDAGDGMPSAPGSAQAPQRPVADPGMQPSQEEIAARAEAMLQGGQPGAEDARDRPERPRTAGRKPPKVTSKVTTREDGPGLTQGVAPPTIIAEGAKDDDDEDMFEAPVQQSGMGGPMKADDGAPHGKLVQDLLKEKKAEEDKERLRQEEEATREEVEEPGQKGIKMGRLKRKKEQAGSAGEIDTAKLSESIQQLCQAANPLGKSIDLVHQDIANMGKELDHWKQEYREASEQYQTELKMTDELLQPLYQKIAELDDRIAEQKTKIRNSRSRISKNDVKITGLLESVVMAK